ncbi:hypothetical protein [Arcanobacterium phocae]|uniref:hypothetical protein n=2 Tax=Arcanobacterium phocae TaxID=131112 RepID=UPI001C0F20BC|nr:hypothetical protein [Arcanobacterium phocae]
MVSLQKFSQRVRDPRLLLGMVLILGGGVAGAALAGTSTTVLVPQAIENIAVGSDLHTDSFRLVEVPQNIAESYVHGMSIPLESRAQRSIATGELLSTKTLSRKKSGAVLALPLVLPIPSDMKAGDQVTIWSVPRSKEGNSEVVAQQATFVKARENRALTDGKVTVEVRVSRGGVANIIDSLSHGDSFVIVDSSDEQ